MKRLLVSLTVVMTAAVALGVSPAIAPAADPGFLGEGADRARHSADMRQVGIGHHANFHGVWSS